ncbi:class I SAM-dependent methyltransferase [Streptomyces sp. NPDC056656]|uniref:class I SAM-dependent methyltransferase n=1 Tax=Streptomyces sp. NPDC056656 TaxID=3345895 RepID=UPI0036C5E245
MKNADKLTEQFYEGLGAHYDVITRGQRLNFWAGMYADLIERHGAPGKKLLDLGCGTGKSSLELARNGFQVTGVDASPQMLEVARRKQDSEDVTFLQADVRALPDLGHFDIVTTMGEPFTHLKGESDLAQAFDCVAQALAPGGLFVFDLPTPGFNDRLATWSTIDEAEDAVVLWRGAPSAEGTHTTDLTVDVFTARGDGTWLRSKETAIHHYVAPDRVEALLAASGLSMELAYGLHNGELQPDIDLQAHRKYLTVARA